MHIPGAREAPIAPQADDTAAARADDAGMPTTTNIIETHGVTKRFGARAAVIDLNLTVPRGSAFGFLGHNGAGKTTLIRMLLGLTQADAGTMTISGRPVPEERAQVLARVGAMVEEPHFHRHLTGRENLRVIAAARGPEAAGRIDGALGRVGLTDRADDRVKTYSQGMRQRLGVARCRRSGARRLRASARSSKSRTSTAT